MQITGEQTTITSACPVSQTHKVKSDFFGSLFRDENHILSAANDGTVRVFKT